MKSYYKTMASSIIKTLFLIDKKKLETKTTDFYHQLEFDVLDTNCYGLNQRITLQNDREKYVLFLQLQRQNREVICRNIGLSCSIKSDWVRCNKEPQYIYAKWPEIKILSNQIYQPLTLLNIVAAATIKIINDFDSSELLFVFNIVKNKVIFIRAGPNHERKLYNFANIVKHFMYKKEIEPILPIEYFVNVIINPVSFCICCGIFQKIEQSLCFCKLCKFLRYAYGFTSNIEKPYHTHTK